MRLCFKTKQNKIPKPAAPSKEKKSDEDYSTEVEWEGTSTKVKSSTQAKIWLYRKSKNKFVIKAGSRNETNMVTVLLINFSFINMFIQWERFVTTPGILLASSGWRSGVDKHLLGTDWPLDRGYPALHILGASKRTFLYTLQFALFGSEQSQKSNP